MRKLNLGNVPNVFSNYFTIKNSVHDYNTTIGLHVPKLEMIM